MTMEIDQLGQLRVQHGQHSRVYVRTGEGWDLVATFESDFAETAEQFAWAAGAVESIKREGHDAG